MTNIKIIVNGNDVEIKENSTIQDFIAKRHITGKMFAIEKNLEIINKDRYETEVIKDGDVIEIVGFFGGG